MFELECPYCESEQEPLYDNAESGVWFNHKCTNCSKVEWGELNPKGD